MILQAIEKGTVLYEMSHKSMGNMENLLCAPRFDITCDIYINRRVSRIGIEVRIISRQFIMYIRSYPERRESETAGKQPNALNPFRYIHNKEAIQLNTQSFRLVRNYCEENWVSSVLHSDCYDRGGGQRPLGLPPKTHFETPSGQSLCSASYNRG